MTEPADSQRLLAAFDGAIITRLIPHPHRSFAFEVTFDKTTWPASLTGKKPPLHFHPHQEEYMQVLEGHLCVEVDGKEMVLDPKDGEISVKPWINHRLYPPPDFGGTSIIKFLLSGQSTMELFRLDLTFFENWYGYQDEIVLTGKTMNIIQVMSVNRTFIIYLPSLLCLNYKDFILRGEKLSYC
ncbi:hypothetical protein MMC17_006308 [Xylographa soralifera]|nr:hypothetical protein [Xylographa soralifera]